MHAPAPGSVQPIIFAKFVSGTRDNNIMAEGLKNIVSDFESLLLDGANR
jgi:hypothetical protein